MEKEEAGPSHFNFPFVVFFPYGRNQRREGKKKAMYGSRLHRIRMIFESLGSQLAGCEAQRMLAAPQELESRQAPSTMLHSNGVTKNASDSDSDSDVHTRPTATRGCRSKGPLSSTGGPHRPDRSHATKPSVTDSASQITAGARHLANPLACSTASR